MKIEIVTEKTVPRFKVKEGWSIPNGVNKDYLDVETDLFTIPQPDGQKIYIQQIVTLVAPAGNSNFTEAYTYVRQNNPDGDHDESPCAEITVEVAISMCLEAA